MAYDAIIIGAGHNGITAGIYLAKAGLKTLILERNAEPGGAIRSAEITRPGFVHDLYAANQNLFLGSQLYRDFGEELSRYGLSYCVSDKPFANVFPGNKSLRVYQDEGLTLYNLAEHHNADAQGWQSLYKEYKKFSPYLLPLLTVPLPSGKASLLLAKAVAGLGIKNTLQLLQLLASSTAELGNAYLHTPEARALLASWGMHLDFGPQVSGGAMFPLMEAFSNMEQGMAFVKGGSSQMVQALLSLYKSMGGEIRTAAEVTKVQIQRGKVRGVQLGSREQYATRSVLAVTNPTQLFGRLIAEAELPYAFKKQVDRYQYGPGTLMIHVALKDKVAWSAHSSLSDFAYIHAGPYVEDIDRAYLQATHGYLPENPMVIVGQPSVVDPSRAPAGQQVLWIQVRALPAAIRGDAAQQIAATEWDAVKESYADRVLDKLQQFAPGIAELVLDRVVFSPLDLERSNPNLQGGDSLAGSHHIRQNFMFRPLCGYSRYRMPVRGLYMAGASTWPGAGIHATSGYLAAQQMLEDLSGRGPLLATAAALAGGMVAGRMIAERLKER